MLSTALSPAQQADKRKLAEHRDRETAVLCIAVRMPDFHRTLARILLHSLTRHELIEPIHKHHCFQSQPYPTTHSVVN